MGSKDRIAREKAQLKKRRTDLISSRAEALFLKKGFRATTIGDIAEACELTNAAIYLYFKNKDELILDTMVKVSSAFADLMSLRLVPGHSGFQQCAACLDLYGETFRKHRAYHILDGQFNALYDNSYPDSDRVDDFFRANSRVRDTLKKALAKGVKDGTLTLPVKDGEKPLERSALMLLNVTNSFVEKLSLRQELMEREQKISLEEELDDFIGFLKESLRA